MQTVPATAQLGPGKTGLAIGIRVLNLDGTTYAAFSTTGVAETSVLGTYRKASGVVVPDAGGYIVWGTALVDYAEATVAGNVDENAIATATAAAILVTPANKLATSATGEASANVTLWNGAVAPALLDLDTVLETPVTLGEALRVMLAALAGKTDGSGTPALTFLGQDGATVRIAATVDGIGNRTAVTVDGA